MSYIAIYVAQHYFNGVVVSSNGFNLRNPVEFTIVFSTNMFFTLFAFKSFDEVLESIRDEEIVFNPVKKEEIYALYEEIKKD